MRPVLANMGLVLQLAGILVAFPIVMGFISAIGVFAVRAVYPLDIISAYRVRWQYL